MRKTINEVRNYFVERGCELLENEYVNAHTKMKYRCVCGNESSINFNNFSNGKRCGCGRIGIKRLTQNEIKIEVEARGCKLISEDYVDGKHIINCICHCGQKRCCELRNLRASKSCQRCRNQELRLEYKNVKKFFFEQGCELLEDNYINARTPLRYKCACGTESKIVFDSFKRGNRCKNCGISKRTKNCPPRSKNKKTKNKKTSKNNKNNKYYKKRIMPTQEYVLNYYKSQNCELLDNYQHSRTPMKYRCCCGNISKSNWNNFKRGKRCQNCLRIKRSGPNNYQWIADREAKKEYDSFKQRCYKFLKIALKATGQKKNSRTEHMLGYTIKEFHNHITSHPGWPKIKNSRWHVDHIFPIKAFVDCGIADIKIINCLDNLQPMYYKDNIAKSDKYDAAAFREWLKKKGITI